MIRINLMTKAARKRLSSLRWRERNPEKYRADNLASAKRSALRNPEKTAENKRRYQSANREKVATARKAWRDHNPTAHDIAIRTSHLKKQYGITLEEYQAMVQKQSGLCEICHKGPCEGCRNLSVDHDHITSKIRGLLCRKCNRAIGWFERDRIWLDSALAYLEKYR